VRRIIRQTVLLYPFPGAWHGLSDKVRRIPANKE